MSDNDKPTTIELEPSYPNLDKVPEAQRAFYAQREDGSYLLNVGARDGMRLENVDGLRNTVSATRAERDTARRALTAFGDVKPEDVTALREENETLREQVSKSTKGKKGGASDDETLRQLQDKHLAEMGKKDSLISKRTSQLQKELVDGVILRHLPEGAKRNVVLPALRDIIRTQTLDDGSLVTRIYESEKSQTPRMTNREGSTEDMTVEEFMKDVFLKEFSDFVPGTRQSGGGGHGSEGGGPGGSSNLGPHVISREDAKDTRLYRAAKAAAEKAGTTLTIADA